MAEGPSTDQNSTQQNFAAHANTDQSSSDQEADQCTTQIEGEPENTDQLSTQLDQDHKKQTEEIPGSKDKDNNRLQNDEPSKRDSEIDRELDDLMKQFLNGKINSAQMTRLMNKVITKTTTRGKVSERWETKTTESDKTPKLARTSHLSTRTEQGSRSLQNLYTDKHQTDSHAKSQPNVVNKVNKCDSRKSPSSTGSGSSGIIKSADSKRNKSGVIKHVRISEPEVASLDSQSVSSPQNCSPLNPKTNRDKQNNLNTECNLPSQAECPDRNIGCHSYIGQKANDRISSDPTYVFGRGIIQKLKDSSRRSATGEGLQLDVTKSPVAEISDFVRGKVSTIRSQFENMKVTAEQYQSPTAMRRKSDSERE